MMHGWGGSKTDFESTSPADHYNNNFFARQGYAVLNYTARGFGQLMRRRAERRPRGALWQGLHPPGRHPLRGPRHPISAGAARRRGDHEAPGDRRHRDLLRGWAERGARDAAATRSAGRTASSSPWRSPDGKPMAIRAAYPRWPWSDLDRRAASQRPLPGHPGRPLQAEPEPGRGDDPELRRRALSRSVRRPGTTAVARRPRRPCTNPDANINQNFAYLQAGQPLSPAPRRL